MTNRLAGALLLLAAHLAGCSSSDDNGPTDAQPNAALDAMVAPNGCATPPCSEVPDGAVVPADRIPLASNWQMSASTSVTETGDAIATAGYAAGGWLPITLPATVMAGLLQNQQHEDLYYSSNLQSIDTAPFAQPWWYRTEFTIAPEDAGKTFTLHFDGINYKASVWLNGQLLAGPDDVIGTFRQFDFDVTKLVHGDKPNALALEVTAPDLAKDLTLTWVDWNPAPPDRGLGIWRDVYLTRTGPVSVRFPQVATQLDLPSVDTAHLTVRAELHNASAGPVDVKLSGTIDSTIAFDQTVTLAAGEQKTVSFAPSSFPQLTIDHPTLWWPRDLGAPARHDLLLTAEVGGVVSDTRNLRFGMRQVTSTMTATGGRLFAINGKSMLIRGGAWTPDMLLRPNWAQTRAAVRYVNDLGLNAVRIEGKLVWDELYDLFDEAGIVVILGWNCCDHWQEWPTWSAADHAIASASLHDQSLQLRSHPSIIDFLIGSDEAPPADVEKEFLDVLSATAWPNVISSSAADTTTPMLAKSGFKMPGPYDWVSPSYWTIDTANGGAFGFNTETSPGPAIPNLESLQQMLTAAEQDTLWKQAAAKQLHGGKAPFDNLGISNAALKARYGAATSLADYVKKAQLMSYEGERAMFEGYSRNKYSPATGVVQWMMNNSWPSLIWHLFDYYLSPGGGYYGAKKANERLHIQYSYDNQSIYVVNHGGAAVTGLTAKASVYNLDGSQKYTNSVATDAPADSSRKTFTLPATTGLSATYLVVLTLSDGTGAAISNNVYWLSTKAEQMDFAAGDWYHTPTTQYADLTGLATLPMVPLTATATPTAQGASVKLQNSSTSVAFFVRLKLTRGTSGPEVLPVFWSDNLVALLPGEQRTLTVAYTGSDLQGATPAIDVSGWNVTPQTLSGF